MLFNILTTLRHLLLPSFHLKIWLADTNARQLQGMAKVDLHLWVHKTQILFLYFYFNLYYFPHNNYKPFALPCTNKITSPCTFVDWSILRQTYTSTKVLTDFMSAYKSLIWQVTVLLKSGTMIYFSSSIQ